MTGEVMNDLIDAVVLSIVEGITEFLPVSSTGHLILFEKIFSLSGDKIFQDTFLVVIQFPAILAVLVKHWEVLLPPLRNYESQKKWLLLWLKIVVAFFPAGIVGFLLDDFIDYYLFNPMVVAMSLVIGGIVMLLFEYGGYIKNRISRIEMASFKFALGVGLVQCLAMIPGVSRSAATIIGALVFGANRIVAVEFSFYLAIPTLAGACFLRMVKHGMSFSSWEYILIVVGSMISFFVSYVVITFFINFVKKRSFSVFGWYRILVGAIVLLVSLFV